MVLEKTLESPLDCKEIQPVHSEGDQPWDFFGRTDAKAETPIPWLPDAKNRLLERTLMLGKIDAWVGKIPWRKSWQPTAVFLPGESLWTEEPGGLQSMGLQKSRT